ncbi:hypothetical protein [Demequina sp. NBRC 110055]|uniref:hypothetical protein n=1 Tax=Demequina sp. NBRC 110055 TaxID=1570344 RepID=UPI000A03CF6F|nr:hypothetical protein [Demequina sp. NBRC 110055]
MKIMHRRLQEVRDERQLGRVFALEARSEELMRPLGHPEPERFRVFAAGELHSQTRIQERTYASFAEWAAAIEASAASLDLAALEPERRDLFEWEREELFYVDAFGDTVPAWVELVDQAVQTQREAAAAKLDELLAAAGRQPAVPESAYRAPDIAEDGEPSEAPAAIRTRKPMPIMYRQIQEIRPGMWQQQFELEHRTDVVESAAGHPLPNRHRAFAAGSLDSQLRIHQRVYPSIADWGRFFEEWTTHEEMQALEIERRQFYTWEREELLYVDLPGERPIRWMELMVEAHGAASAGDSAELRSILRHL